MNEFLEKAMVFINENTMLLIGICIFLIIVLIGYLIDNAIKTRRLEKQELSRINEEKEVAVEEKTVEAPVAPTPVAPIEPEVKEETIEPASIEKPIIPEVLETSNEEIKPEVEEINPSGYIKKEETGYKEIETEDKIIEPAPSPVIAEPISEKPEANDNIEFKAMEDLLNKDFSKNNEVVNNLTDTQIIKPVEPLVTEVTDTPVIDIPEVKVDEIKEEKSTYKNGKSLSDILGKKKEEPKLETTQDFSDELDKILNKLNEETKIQENSLNEEDDFNNRF